MQPNILNSTSILPIGRSNAKGPFGRNTDFHRLGFFNPILGLVNLFVSILKSPLTPSTSADVTLMEIAAGHFAHLEFLTCSELSFPFARECATLCRALLKKVKGRSVAHPEENRSDVSNIGNDGDEPTWSNGQVDITASVSVMAMLISSAVQRLRCIEH